MHERGTRDRRRGTARAGRAAGLAAARGAAALPRDIGQPRAAAGRRKSSKRSATTECRDLVARRRRRARCDDSSRSLRGIRRRPPAGRKKLLHAVARYARNADEMATFDA
ncbi:MAG: hypothetical protein HY060_19525 [Proteobacteria bacterium]|nr:hypothetical protein [Pseudomonadota bacterium]